MNDRSEPIQVIQFVYTGLLLYYTREVLASNKSVIGFYFDGMGLPREIHRHSSFGSAIIKRETYLVKDKSFLKLNGDFDELVDETFDELSNSKKD